MTSGSSGHVARSLPAAGQALLAAAALGAFLLLAADAALRFSLLALPARLLILLAGASGLFAARRLGASGRRILLPLLAGCVALCAIGIDREVRATPSGDAADALAAARQAAVADQLQADFAALMQRLRRPLDIAASEPPQSGVAGESFDWIEALADRCGLPEESFGLTLYDTQGRALAWTGASFPAQPALLGDRGKGALRYRAVAEPHQARLLALLDLEGKTLVAETIVDLLLDPQARRRALPSLADETLADLRLQDYRAEAPGFDDLLLRHADRYPGAPSGRHRLLFVGLRAPDRSFLGYATLRGPSSADLTRRGERNHRVAALLVVAGTFLAALSLSAFAGAGPVPHPLLHPAAFLFLLWAGRIALAWFPLPDADLAGGLFDPSRFALSGFLLLLRSPFDSLLTAAALAASAVVLGRLGWSAAAAGSRRWAVAGGAAAIGLLFAGQRGLTRFLPAVIDNANVGLLDLDFLDPVLPALALQASLLLILFSWIVLMLTSLRLLTAPMRLPRSLETIAPEPGGGLSRWTLRGLLPCAVLAGLLYEPILTPRVTNGIEKLFETVLMPGILTQHEGRVALLGAALDELRSMSDLAERLSWEEAHGESSLALTLWLRTSLASSGYSSSLRLEDPEGRVLSRFSRNLPPALDSHPPGRAGESEPTEERVPVLGRTRRILHARHDVFQDGVYAGAVTLHLLDEFENVPFLTPEAPYMRALAPAARSVIDLPAVSGAVRHTVYQPDGLTVFSTQREALHLPAGAMALMVRPGQFQWYGTPGQEGAERSLIFSDGRHLFALGFRLPGFTERAARGVRAVILALIALACGLLPAGSARLAATGGRPLQRLLAALGRTHYRKLMVTFALVTTVPLLALSALLSGYIRAQIDRGVAERGAQAIRSAGDIMRVNREQDRDATMDDNILYGLSLLVGEDVNFYLGGEIAATSRRELFSSGMLSPRVEGQVWRRLAIEGAPFAMGRKSLRGYEYRTITSPLQPENPVHGGLISLPLEAEAAEASRRAREVGDVILLTFAAMGLLTGLVAYLLARRFSRPIRSLSEAAASIAAGNLDAMVSARPRDETGDLIASFNSMARALKEQREDLERRRDYIEKILANATIGIVSLDAEGRIVTANPAASSILELPPLPPGASLKLMLAGRPELSPLIQSLEHEGGPQAREMEMPLPGPRPDRAVRMRLVPFLEGRGVLLLIEDVTETTRSNRLAAWAEMARRIAHEIKNPLTPIQLSAEHIRRVQAERSPDFPAVLEICLRTIMGEVAKLRQISMEFSSYARTPTPKREPVPMGDLLDELIRPYSAAAPAGIAIRTQWDAPLPVLSVDRALLSRALVNLVENALQAMPRGGELGCRAGVDGDWLRIDIEDTGVGMDAASQARIFEPYFSTKDTGTGLGLAIARKAIEEHGGTIEVQSSIGRGTRMTVRLPLR